MGGQEALRGMHRDVVYLSISKTDMKLSQLREKGDVLEKYKFTY
jgi:hypothetical protein